MRDTSRTRNDGETPAGQQHDPFLGAVTPTVWPPNPKGSQAGARGPVPAPAAARGSFRDALTPLLGGLALVAVGLSLGAENPIHGKLLISSAVILVVLAFRVAETRPQRTFRPNPTTSAIASGTTTMTTSTPGDSTHVLIDGTFDGSDAQEILLTLLNSKIAYHTRRCFSATERFGEPDTASERRLEELKATRTAVKLALATAVESGQPVRIESVVHVSIQGEAALQGARESGSAGA